MARERSITELKERLDSLKTNIAIYENSRKKIVDELKDKYSVKSSKEALAKKEDLKKKIQDLNDKKLAALKTASMLIEKYQARIYD